MESSKCNKIPPFNPSFQLKLLFIVSFELFDVLYNDVKGQMDTLTIFKTFDAYNQFPGQTTIELQSTDFRNCT